MAKLILLRHGKSQWNKQNIFTGWVDIPLAPEGIEEAIAAGREMAEHEIDLIYTSTLVRAMQTVMIAMAYHKTERVPAVCHLDGEANCDWYCVPEGIETIPVMQAWQLNERMYGELQGKNKQTMREEFGDEQVKIWRRSFATCPPGGESLEKTAKRTLPYFDEVIVPQLEAGKNVLISAHGNSLRSIVMELDNLSQEEVLQLEIPTGKPLYYNYEGGRFALL
ncbi:MAG: 2,3-bisphosphoglycerate-dependent phosphoglycerate mutase [Chlamydiales bacterium]|nr:2,3-bisphosphoglycerate-dependent phosphoglycerate mutase [Chlamydiales bacterium]MCH9635699.1 2,3-bisphosphoglycerate-dependent phosphoglycerate mutase [Chlamydiales bacterium]MCH9704492.1 2,3-bisphosphoglycerate-dependent phosphoglycerate mutase [Chlamydiota bacterium]